MFIPSKKFVRFFKITADGVFTIIKTLSYSTDGGTPYGSLLLGTDGNFYGTMSSGGQYSAGLIFKITPAGAITRLRHLNPATDGSTPKGNLVQGSDGALYGTTSKGGSNDAGTIFRLSGTTYSVLRHLNMATDGGSPLGGLILTPKINLTATAQSGLTTLEDVSKTITLAGTGATTLTYTIVTPPKNGTLSSGTGASRTYKPKKDFNGVDSFSFRTNLGCLSSQPAWVKITVSAVNDAPVITPIGSKSVVLGSTLSFTATATDVDKGQTKTFSLASAPLGAQITTAGVFGWKPASVGTYKVVVRVVDNGVPQGSDTDTATIQVTAAAPITATAAPEAQSLSASRSAVAQTPAAPAATILFPNPVTNQFTVALSATSGQAAVVIYDAKGSVVYTGKPQVGGGRFQVDATALRPGQYFLRVQTDKQTDVVRFVKL